MLDGDACEVHGIGFAGVKGFGGFGRRRLDPWGEQAEIFPFIGSSRLEEPLCRYPVTAVFHGHAHFGSPEGRLDNGVPVYNVSIPLLRKTYPDRPPFRLIEVPLRLVVAS